MKEFTYTIKDEQGIHARPAGILVKAIAKKTSDIKIKKAGDTREVNAKSIMAVMSLGVNKGNEVIITAEGEDAAAAPPDGPAPRRTAGAQPAAGPPAARTGSASRPADTGAQSAAYQRNGEKAPGRAHLSPAADLGHGGVPRADPRRNAVVHTAPKSVRQRQHGARQPPDTDRGRDARRQRHGAKRARVLPCAGKCAGA